MADPDTCPGGNLPPEVVERIVHFLSPNEVACSCRLLNKALTKQFNGFISVRLSQPVPHHAFVRRWGDARGIHGLTLERRQRLLCLTARSGVIANLEVAVTVTFCGLGFGELQRLNGACGLGFCHRIFNAAAEGGHLVVCVWLLDRGCPCDVQEASRCAVRAGHMEVVRWALAHSLWLAGDVLGAAAGAGQRALCEEVLPLVLAAGEAGALSISKAACSAAEGGHVELTEWLLGQLPEPARASGNRELLRCAAGGLELPALERFYDSAVKREAAVMWEIIDTRGGFLTDAAFSGPNPGWRAKLKWLEAGGYRLRHFEKLWNVITGRGDAVERLALLWERGYMRDVGGCLYGAVANANLTVVRYLRSERLLTGEVDVLDGVVTSAMGVGDLAVFAELLEVAGTIMLGGVYAAARHGHLHVLRWLEGPEAGPQAAAVLQEALQNAKLAEDGARSGSLELMEWLWERGCPSEEERVFTAAAEAGNGALLERLVARGCPMSCDAYLAAGRNNDLATMRCLRELDCPWGPGCSTFNRAVSTIVDAREHCCSLAVLRWLVAEGCPVDWQSARARVVDIRVGAADMLDWIESHIPQA